MRPIMANINFTDNSAMYGNDIASYPVKLVLKGTQLNQIVLSEAPSGLAYQEDLSFDLVDFDDQVMNLQNELIVKVMSVSSTSKVEGIDSAKFNSGTALFSNLVMVDEPGVSDVQYLLYSDALSKTQIMKGLNLTEDQYEHYINKLIVSFRFCSPGEIISSDQKRCRVCSAGSYSLDWNSTKCNSCMDNAVCNGGVNIEVKSGYWRSTSNSTSLIHCLNEDA